MTLTRVQTHPSSILWQMRDHIEVSGKHRHSAGGLKVFLAISGTFVPNTADSAYTACAIARRRLTAQASSRSILIRRHGNQTGQH
jgi:hypothetical protein